MALSFKSVSSSSIQLENDNYYASLKPKFEEFNELFLSKTVISIPQQSISIIGDDYDEISDDNERPYSYLNVTNFECFEFRVGNIQDRIQKINRRRTRYILNIVDLTVTCNMNWLYVRGSKVEDYGSASFYVGESSIALELLLQSSEFIVNSAIASGPISEQVNFYPTYSEFRRCDHAINIGDIDFFGGIRATLLNIIEDLLHEKAGTTIGNTLCDILHNATVSGLNGMLTNLIDEIIEPYLLNSDDLFSNIDPLAGEMSWDSLNESPKVMDFTKSDIFKIVNATNELFSTKVYDPDGPNELDLGLNVMLRSNVLDENRMVSLPTTTFAPSETSSFQLNMTSLNIIGLDTFSSIGIMETIGPQTLTNYFFLNNLELEAKFALKLIQLEKPGLKIDTNTDDEGVFVQIPDLIEEDITITTGIRGIDSRVSFFLTIDNNATQHIHMFNILNASHYSACFRSVSYEFNFTELKLFISAFDAPRTRGLFSAGVDDLAVSLSQTIFDQYGDAFQSVIPNYIGTKFREFLNTFNKKLWNDPSATCPTYSDVHQESKKESGLVNHFIDFRDLLLDPVNSKLAGGSGTMPYGDISSKMLEIMTNFITEPNEDDGNRPNINAAMIAPLTAAQSNRTGSIISHNEIPLINTSMPLVEKGHLDVKLINSRMENIDNINYPIKILQPQQHQPYILDNQFMLDGGDNKPLRIATEISFNVGLKDIDSHNHIDIVLDFHTVEILGSIQAKVDEQAFMELSLENMMNMYCWFATIPAPPLDNYGLPTGNSSEESLTGFSDFLLSVVDFEFSAECISCNSAGIVELPNILFLMEKIGTTKYFIEMVTGLLNDVAMGERIQVATARFLVDARKRCPSHVEFMEQYEKAEYEANGSELMMSNKLAEVYIFSISIVSQVAMLVASLTILDEVEKLSDPLSHEKSLASLEDKHFLNFTSLDSPIGNLVQKFVDKVNSMVEDHNEISSILRSSLLGDNGVYTLYSSTDITTGVVLESVSFGGIDSLKSVGELEYIGSHTLRSHFTLDNVSINLNFTLSTVDINNHKTKYEESMVVSFQGYDVGFDASVFLGIDETVIGNIPIGSMMEFENIVPCFFSGIDINITQFLVSIGAIDEIKINGFVSEEVKSTLSDSSITLLYVYGSRILDSIPFLFDSIIRPLANLKITEYLSLKKCPSISSSLAESNTPMYVDFRDLLLNENQAVAAGSTNFQSYGDILPTLMDYLNSLIAPDDISGSPTINEAVIVPLTERNSNITGTLNIVLEGECDKEEVPDQIISFPLPDVEDIKLVNFDTVGYPFKILQPVKNESNIISNEFSVGEIDRPLKIMSDLIFFSTDRIRVSLNLKEATFIGNILVNVDKRKFIQHPLRDITNIPCWLSMVSDDVTGSSNLVANASTVAKHSYLDVKCVSCESVGMKELPIILYRLESLGVVNEFVNRLILFEKTFDISEGDSFVSSVITNSRKLCELDSSYDPEFAQSRKTNACPIDIAYSIYEMVQLTYSEIETLILGAALLTEVWVVILSMNLWEEYTNSNDDTNDHFAAVSLPRDVSLLDFTNPSIVIGRYVINSLTEFFNSMDSMKKDPGKVKEQDLGINILLRSHILDEDRSFTLNTNTSVTKEIQLHSIRIEGLDTFSNIEGFLPIAPQYVESKFALERLKAEFNFVFPTEVKPGAREKNTTSNMTVSLIGKDIKVNSLYLVEIDEDLFGNIQLGSLLQVDRVLRCILSCVITLTSPTLSISLDRMDAPTSEGFLSTNVQRTLSKTTDILFTSYSSDILRALPLFSDSFIRELINNATYNHLLRNTSDLFCEEYKTTETEKHSKFIDFRDLLLEPKDAIVSGATGEMPYGDLLIQLMKYLNEELLSPGDDGTPVVNGAVIVPLTTSQSNISGTIIMKGIPRNHFSEIEEHTLLEISDVRLENLDTFSYPIELLKTRADDPYILDNRVNLGGYGKPFGFSARLLFAVDGDDESQLYNDLVISLEVSNVEVFVPLLLKVNEYHMLSIPLQDITNPYCWLASIPAPELNEFGMRDKDDNIENLTAALLDFDISVDDIHLSVDCIKCSSPGLISLEKMLKSPEGQSNSTAMGKVLLNYTRDIIRGSIMQSQIDYLIYDSVTKCPHRNNNIGTVSGFMSLEQSSVPSDAFKVTILLGGSLAIFIFLVRTVNRLLRKVVSKKNKFLLNRLSDTQIRRLYADRVYIENQNEHQRYSTQAMFRSNQIPIFMRIAIPLVIVINICLFLSGHISLGAAVKIDLLLAGEELIMEEFMQFSMANSISALWKNGMRPMAAVLFFSSVLWPYVKQLILFVCWFLPPSKLSTKQRGNIFLRLDALGKWSITDIFMLMTTLIVFRITVKSPNNGRLLPDNFYGLDLLLVPRWGLFSNLIAQILSQISSHWIIYYHRKVVKKGISDFETQEQVSIDPEKCDHSLEINSSSEREIDDKELGSKVKSDSIEPFFTEEQVCDREGHSIDGSSSGSQLEACSLDEKSSSSVDSTEFLSVVNKLDDTSLQSAQDEDTSNTEESPSYTSRSFDSSGTLKDTSTKVSSNTYSTSENYYDKKKILEACSLDEKSSFSVDSTEYLSVVNKSVDMSLQSSQDEDTSNTEESPSYTSHSFDSSGTLKDTSTKVSSNTSSTSENYYDEKKIGEDVVKGIPILEESQSSVTLRNSSDSMFIQPLYSHSFMPRYAGVGEVMLVTAGWNVCVICFGIATIVVLIVGSIVPSFRMEVMGVFGQLMALGHEEGESLISYHNIFSMIGIIMDEAKYLDKFSQYLGLTLLSLLLICTSAFVPVVLATLLLIVWCFSMRRLVRKRVIAAIEILFAWQYVEVLILSLFLGMWQMGDLTEGMVAYYCDSLSELFGLMEYHGIVSYKNARCFYVDATLETGAYILVVGSLMLSGMTVIVLLAEKQQIMNLDESNRRRSQMHVSTIDEDIDEVGLDTITEMIASDFTLEFTDVFDFMAS